MGTVLIILRLLDGLVAVTGALPAIAELRAKMEQFKAEGRDPTTEELMAVFDAIFADSARLDAADKRLNP